MPVVPDDNKLSREDLGHFMRVVAAEGPTTVAGKGGAWRFFNYSQEDMDSEHIDLAVIAGALCPWRPQCAEKL